MEYGIILGFWLLFMFFGCSGLYCFAVPVKVKAIQQAEPSNGHLICDFANEQYRNAWIALQGNYYGTYSEHYTAASYLESALKLDFTMPGKECVAWWQGMIKATKPQSPTHLAYYQHIRIEKPVLRYDKDFNVRIACKPDYPSYGGNGFGYLVYNGNLLCDNGNSWIEQHYDKYPEGKLPEQSIIKSRLK